MPLNEERKRQTEDSNSENLYVKKRATEENKVNVHDSNGKQEIGNFVTVFKFL